MLADAPEEKDPFAAGTLPHAKTVNFLQNVYEGCATGFGTDHTDDNVEQGNLQYGEITYAGMDPLFNALKLEPDDVFYDLGCGTGKLVLYVAIRRQFAAQKGACVGLEVGERRLKTAQDVCDRIQTKLGPKFPEASMLLQDISRYHYEKASVVVLTNLCMDRGVEAGTIACLLKCPSFKRIVCITPIVNPRLKEVNTVKVSCSWAKLSSWHIYDVLSADQVPTVNSRRCERAVSSSASKRALSTPALAPEVRVQDMLERLYANPVRRQLSDARVVHKLHATSLPLPLYKMQETLPVLPVVNASLQTITFPMGATSKPYPSKAGTEKQCKIKLTPLGAKQAK